MNEENELNNYNSNNSQNNFKQVKTKKSSGFGKTIFVPFISGVIGASLTLGIAFNVPSVKTKLFTDSKGTTQTNSESSNYTGTLIDLEEYSNTSINVANKVKPSIVGITVNYSISSIFGNTTGKATGSGIIISEDGYILTNNHVIASENSSSYYAITEATGITVQLYNDSSEYPATVIGTDPYTDLAVIKIDKNNLTAAELGNSDEVQVGEFAMAIGHPLGMESSVTAGIISAVNQNISDNEGNSYLAIQTDAAINSGNSGGALVNSKGQVIGINTLKLAGNGIEGMGFAIPISSTTDVVSQLIEFKAVKRPYIGITGSAVDEVDAKKYNLPKGIFVNAVEKNSPAEKAGIKESDIITKIDDIEVKNVTELNNIKNKHKIGDTVKLSIKRGLEEKEINIVLEEMPQEEKENNVEKIETQNENNDKNDSKNKFSIFDLFK